MEGAAYELYSIQANGPGKGRNKTAIEKGTKDFTT